MRHLVSGAAGFIGSHLCDRLIAEGGEVVAVDNLITGSRANLAQLMEEPRFTFYEEDVCQTEPGLKWNDPAKTGTFDHVWHLASLASPKFYLQHPIETLESGSTATRNMLEVARRDDACFLLSSTSECYGDPLEHPQEETYWGNVNPVGERSCYDESKRFAEAMTMAYHRHYGVATNIARIFNTYGPRMALDDGRVVPAFLEQGLRRQPLTVFGNGLQTRSFCYVSDMVEGLYRLSQSEERFPVNLGNPVEMTILDFAETIQKELGLDLPITHMPLPSDDPRQRQPDIRKAKRVLDWEPKVGLEEGLAKTVAYFQARIGTSVG